MTKRLLDFCPVTGMMTWHEYDESEGKEYITYEQDSAPIIDRNKAMANELSGTRLGDGFLAAEIPNTVIVKWLVEKGVNFFDPDHKPAVLRLLDDPEWRYLKCREVILGGY